MSDQHELPAPAPRPVAAGQPARAAGEAAELVHAAQDPHRHPRPRGRRRPGGRTRRWRGHAERGLDRPDDGLVRSLAAAATPQAAAQQPKVDPDDVGNETNPVTIAEGKAFDVRKFAYSAGWKVISSDFGMEVKNLKVTNNRDDRDGAIVEIKYMKGSEVLASIDCTSDQILPGQTVTLNCFSGDKKPKGFDRITINDTF